MSGILSGKQALRADMLAARAALKADWAVSASALIMDRIMALSAYRESKTVLCYLDFKNEVMTGALIRGALESGKNVLVPVIMTGRDGEKLMQASKLTGIGNIIPGPMGIREPENPWAADPECIDFFVVPGIAFDLSGNRLGFGRGFVDRFIPRLRPGCMTVAAAYDFQVLTCIPAGENDRPVQLIVTEKRVILPGRHDAAAACSAAEPAETFPAGGR